MAVNGLTNYMNNSLRLTGLASGLDTDTLVKQLMAADKLKINRVIQKRELDLWRTEAYREVSSTLKNFYNEYFDTLSSKNLKSPNSFSSFSASYSATNSTEYVTVTPGATAKAGTYTITSMKAATAAALSSSKSVTGVVSGALVGSSIEPPISSENKNNIMVLTLNNVTKTITLPNSVRKLDPESELDPVRELDSDYVKSLQGAIDDAFGKGKIIVGTGPLDSEPIAGKPLIFTTARSTDSFSIGTVYNNGADELFNAKPSEAEKFKLNSTNNKFDLIIGDEKVQVVIPLDDTVEFDDANELASKIKAAVDIAIEEYNTTYDKDIDSDEITFSAEDGKVIYNSNGISINKSEDSPLGLNPSNTAMGNKVDLYAKIADIKGGFASLAFGTGEKDIEFSINGKYFRFDSKTTSLNDIMKAVNADTTINATMKYDITSNTFKIESRRSGDTDNLEVLNKTDGNLMSVLGVAGTAKGTDAIVKIKGLGGSNDEVEIVRPTGAFIYEGLTFNIKMDFTSSAEVEPIKVTVASDTTKTYDYIKTFVDKYNEIIGNLNNKISEKVYREYAPLSDEQKEAMKEDQIKKWEEKAKSGLLKNDSILSNTLTQLRTALYASVEGVGVTLSSIGITTSSNYMDKGKLIINEDKLKEALASKPEEVANLFTKSSDITYYDAMNSSTLKNQRNRESGIAYKLSDIIQDAIRTNTNSSGNKGTLLEKAGIVGDRSEFSNLLSKEIMEFDRQVTELNNKLLAKENSLYNKFAKMESALNNMNAQQSWLTQQLGGNSW